MSSSAEAPQERSKIALYVSLVLVATGTRLISLHWLHPLQWDEVEYFRATDWVRQGLVPFRDFWEHHTPLQWFVFAPWSALTSDEGVSAIVTMRWLQVPFWIAAFALLMVWMRRAFLPAQARWAAMSIVLGSSLFMIPAVEYRIDTLGCVLYIVALALLQKMHTSRSAAIASGVVLTLAGLANLRLGPLLAVTVILVRVIDADVRAWRNNVRAQWVWLGVALTLLAAVSYLTVTDSLAAAWRHVWVENYVGERYAQAIPGAVLHRILVPFGVRFLASESRFDAAGIDAGGMVILVLGTVGMLRAFSRWRSPDWLFLLAMLQAVNVLFIFRMKNVYVYHFEIIALLMLPLIAAEVARWRRRNIAAAVAIVAVAASSFAAVFRGKELDRAYQDLVMKEAHARSRPGDRVFDGVGWALRREPAYRFWFLPDLARQLVSHRQAAPYTVQDAIRHPPAVVIADQNAIVWMSRDRALMSFLASHYIPVWRNLWVPGMNAVVAPERSDFEWIVPRDGEYRPLASEAMTGHLWFRAPLLYASDFSERSDRRAMALPPSADRADLTWSIDGRPLRTGGPWLLRRGQRLRVQSAGATPLAVVVLATAEMKIFQQPPVGVSIDAAAPRITHVPDFYPAIQ